MSALSPVVEERVGVLLDALDDAMPGRIEGLYLVGSVAYGDFHEHTSDIDVVAVAADDQPFGPDDQSALAAVHHRTAASKRRPHVDGWYTTWSGLRSHPESLAPMPQAHEGS